MDNMRDIRLISFDVDGVIFNINSSWLEFHKQLGTLDLERLENLQQSYLKGKISYKQWADEEVSVWKGIPYKKFVEICNSFPFVNGAEEAIKELKEKGYILYAVSSGGLQRPVTERLKNLGFESIYSNDLEEKEGILTGNFILNVEFRKKHEILHKITEKENISFEECAVVGDDINDLAILRKVKLSIAFCPKDMRLIKAADVVITKKDLKEILAYF
jgi:phosphoserine phosphatase